MPLEKKFKIHSIKFNFLMNLILTTSYFIFPLITFPYVSRVLGAEGIGKVSFATSVSNYFLMVASLGIPTYGIRACAKVRDNHEKLEKTVSEIFLINAVTSTIVTVIFVLSVILIPKFSQDKTLFLVNSVGVFLSLFGMNWLYQALEQYSYITIRSLVIKVISIILMFVFVRSSSDYVIYGTITVFSTVGSYFLNFLNARRFVHLRLNSELNLIQHLPPIFLLFSLSAATSIYTNLDTIMLGFMSGNFQVGLYSSALKLKSILVSLVSSLGNVLLPRMSYIVKSGKKNEFKRITSKSLSFVTLTSIPLAVFFAVNSYPSLLVLSGEGYLQANIALKYCVLSIVPIGITNILGVQVLTSLGQEKFTLISVLVGATVDLVLNLLLIPIYGASGAAFSTLVAEVMVLLVQFIYVKNFVDIKQNIKEILLYLSMSIIAAVGSYLTVKPFFTQLDSSMNSNFFFLLILVILFVGIYCLELLFTKNPFLFELLKIGKKKLNKFVPN